MKISGKKSEEAFCKLLILIHIFGISLPSNKIILCNLEHSILLAFKLGQVRHGILNLMHSISKINIGLVQFDDTGTSCRELF